MKTSDVNYDKLVIKIDYVNKVYSDPPGIER